MLSKNILAACLTVAVIGLTPVAGHAADGTGTRATGAKREAIQAYREKAKERREEHVRM